MRLDDVSVLDLTRLLPGPYATQLLADAGADVVKVEDTGAGDYARYMPPMVQGHGAVFDAVNRGKRSVALDLKTDEGENAFYRLVELADVVIESFRPGVVERLGVDYNSLSEHNNELIYCSLTGYGQSGPYADKAGHDLNYLGLAGFLDMTREDEGAKPQLPGYQVADMAGGLMAAFAVVSALLSRELGDGSGEYLDVGLTDAVVSFAQAVAPEVFTGGDPRPGETALTGGYPWYDIYECADGRYVTLAALEPQFWEVFCDAVDHPEWTSLHMTGDDAERAALRESLENLFAERTREEWIDDLAETDSAVDGVYRPAETFEHAQIESRGYIERPEDAAPRVGLPICGPDIQREANVEVPGHGEHTDELLQEIGYETDELGHLRESGVVR